MKKVNILIIWMLFSLLIAASTAYCLDNGQEPVGEFGYIDWIGMKVAATGIGAPHPMLSMPHRQELWPEGLPLLLLSEIFWKWSKVCTLTLRPA